MLRVLRERNGGLLVCRLGVGGAVGARKTHRCTQTIKLGQSMSRVFYNYSDARKAKRKKKEKISV